MTYRLFEKKHGSAAGEPAITVTGDSFYINSAAREAFDVQSHDSVEFLVNEDKGIIALRLLDKPSLHSNKIPKSAGSCSVSAKAIIEFYKLERGVHPLALNEKAQLLEFSYRAEDDSENEKSEEKHSGKRGRPRKAA